MSVIPPCWQFQMLGNFMARRGEAVITRYRAHQHRALLAYLVFHRGRPQTRERLAALFWPDADPASGRANLRTALSALRRQLEGPGLAPGGTVLVSDGHLTVTLSAEAAGSDVAAFEGGLRRAVAAGARGESEAERAAYEDALAAWSGPLLPGFYEDWALAERNRLDEAYRRALLRLGEIYRRAGERQRALVLARQAVVADPLDEEGHAAAIRLLREMDRDADARRQFRELEKALDQAFGIEPSDAVRALLTAEVVPAPKKPAAPAPAPGPAEEVSAPSPV
ncbi:MAG TPA: BTAD domain-containing putative transcriptional regulator, partial [Armatimonadaceae bacterium]|nr:BTAD domain-containing putative transcriptional regulator [Armatimonadaceae bacterium]